jgi:hypothetical protein
MPTVVLYSKCCAGALKDGQECEDQRAAVGDADLSSIIRYANSRYKPGSSSPKLGATRRDQFFAAIQIFQEYSPLLD